MQTETIDKLFLELSQVTNATTAKEAHLRVSVAGLESSVNHLCALVDEARSIAKDAMKAMKELHESASPDESTPDIDASIPGASFARFVDAHAALLHRIKQSSFGSDT